VLLSACVLATGLALSVAAGLATQRALLAEARAVFMRVADGLETEVSRRFGRAEYGLSGLRAAFAMTGRLDDAGLQAYVASRDMDREFPGMRAFSIVERVPADQRAAFTARVARLHPGFTVRGTPPGAEALVVRSVAPLAGHAASLGVDIAADPLRRAAAQEAVDAGAARLSPLLTLFHQGTDDARRGWVMYLPVYAGQPSDAPARRAALQGLLSVPIGADALLGPLVDSLGTHMGFRLWDGPRGSDQLAFDGIPAWEPAGRWRIERSLVVGDRLLTLELQSFEDLLPATGRMLPWAVGLVGVLVSAAAALLTWLLGRGRLQAQAVAAAAGADRRRLATIVERTAGAVFSMDPQGRLTWCNGGYAALAGRPGESPAGQDALALLGLDGTHAAQRQALWADLEAGRGHRCELARPQAGGATSWIELAVEPQCDAGGRLANYTGIALDIGARKQAEQQLSSREHMLRTITDNIPARVSYWDAQGRCLFANQRFCEVLGRPAAEVVRRGHAELHAAGATDMDAQRVHEVLAEGMPQQFEQLMREPGGRESAWQVHYLPDAGDDARIRGFFVLAIEVTELKRARDAALEASRAKSRFLTSMSHEIRTPMNAILGMLTLLRSTELSGRQADYAGKAETAARSLLALLNDVLDFSKIEAGKMQLDCHPFSLDKMLEDLSVILSANVGERELDVLYDLDPRVPDALVGDDMRLRQVLINLGGNAVKFTPAGEVVLRTRLLALADGQATIEFSVQDTGIGMSAEQQERLFHDYMQASEETARLYGGTGLGLGICRRLTELMGSRLQVDSTPGRGSRFWFELTLPVLRATGAGVTAAPLPGIERVMIVDDNESARLTLSALAASEGWQVDTAAGGREGLERVAAAAAAGRPYDAIFLDWRMPDVDGWQASLRIRALPAGTRMPLVVMVTAHGREMLAQRPAGEQALLDGFLVKPVTAPMLRDAVARARAPKPDATGAGEAATALPAPQPLAGLRVLVAEDNPVNQQIARELLGGQGALVDVVDDGAAAVERLRGGARYDAVLMDMLMPVMGGLEATRRIRAEPALAGLPVIAMTANALDTDRAACLAAGMDDHVGKPVELAEVVAAILRRVAAPGATAVPVVPAPAQPQPAAGDAPLFDRVTALARLGGNTALYEKLLPVFRANLERSAGELRAAADRPPPAQDLARTMHALKGMAGSVGATRLAGAAAAAERRLRDGDEAAAAPCAREVGAVAAETLAALSAGGAGT
jgi:PAS domain S-box-containing protein